MTMSDTVFNLTLSLNQTELYAGADLINCCFNSSSNVSNQTSCNDGANGLSFWKLILLAFPIFTVFGNVLVVLSVYLEKSLQTVTNYFIVSLAFADIMLAVSVMPLAAWVEVIGGMWPFGDTFCDIFVMFDVLFCTASILNLAAISIDRFVAVTKPIQYSKNKHAQGRVYVSIGLTWAISLSIALPIGIGMNRTKWREDQKRENECSTCIFFNPDFLIYSSLGSFYIPCGIMILLYHRIFKVIHARAKRQKMARQGKTIENKHINCAQPVGLASSTTVAPVLIHGGSGVGAGQMSTMVMKNGEAVMAVSPARRPTQLFVTSSMHQGRSKDVDLYDKSFVRSNAVALLCEQRELKELHSMFSKSSSSHSSSHSSSSCGVVAAHSKPCLSSSHGGGQANSDIFIEEEEMVVQVAADFDFATARRDIKMQQTNPILSSSLSNENGVANSQQLGFVKFATSLKKRFLLPNKNNMEMTRNLCRANLSADAVVERIGKVKRKSKRKVDRSAAKKERKATKTLAIVLGVFLFCWLPFFTMNMVNAFCTKFNSQLRDLTICSVPSYIMAMLVWLGYINSFINPVIYTIFNVEFRRAFLKLLTCTSRHRSSRIVLRNSFDEEGCCYYFRR